MCSPAPVLVAPALQHILFATDFSACSQAALPYACNLARRFGCSLHVVHVIAPEPGVITPLDSGFTLHMDQQRAEVEMAKFVSSDALKPIRHHATVERGPVSDIILALIEQENIDLIVFGPSGRIGLKTPVLGSLAEQVLGLAPCPVLSIGPHVAMGGSGEFVARRILYATDFGSSSRHALPYAVWLAEESAADLMLVHVVHNDVEDFSKTVRDGGAAAQRLEELLPSESVHGRQPEAIVASGEPSDTIVRIAHERNADLIVMGAHHAASRTITTQATWTTASIVIAKAHCPVLTAS